MFKERTLLKSLYTMIFHIDTIQIVLLNEEQTNGFDFYSVMDKESGKIKINKDLFIQNYKELTNYEDDLKKIEKVNIPDLISAVIDYDVKIYDFSKENKLNQELRGLLESIINSKSIDLNIMILNETLIEKFKYLFKTICIDLNCSDKRLMENFVETHKRQKRIKDELLNRIDGNSKNQEMIDNLKNFIENLKNKTTSDGFKNNGFDDVKLEVFGDEEINLDSDEEIQELNDRFEIINVVKPKETFEDIIGMESVKKRLNDLVLLYKEDYEILQKYKIERDKGFILYGEPGTGKTMLCKAFAKELNAIFIYLSMEQFMSKKSEKVTIAFLFEEIEELSYMYAKQNIVLFLDELDSLRSRGSSDHNNSFYDGFTNEMLYRIDNLPKNVMIIGATNNIKTIDDAIKRKGRLGNQYEVKNNFTKEDIEKYITKYFTSSNMKILNKYAKDITTMIYYMNGSEIANILNKIKQSYYFKTKYKREIKVRDLIIDTIYGEKYNLSDYKVTPDEQLSTAYHEAGHAIMYMKQYGIEKLHEISIYPTSKTLGFVKYKFDKAEVTKDDLKKLTLISLAGRYAEKLITNNISTGAISDLENANGHIDSIISQYGMGGIENINRNKKLKSVSEYMLAKMDKEHEELLKVYSKETEKIINEHKNVIELMAKELVKEKVLIDKFKKYNDMLVLN